MKMPPPQTKPWRPYYGHWANERNCEGQYAEGYYIRTILSDGIGDTQTGPQGKAGGDTAVYHFCVFVSEFPGLWGCRYLFGDSHRSFPGTFQIHCKRNESHCLSAADHGGVQSFSDPGYGVSLGLEADGHCGGTQDSRHHGGPADYADHRLFPDDFNHHA